DDNWIFCLVMHHIVSDGWSMDIFIRELLSLYQSNCAGELNALAPLRIQYKDYASWQQEQLVTGVFETHKKYWLEQFSGELPVLSGLGDLIRPDTRATTGSVFVKALCEDDISRLKTYVQQEGGSIFMGFLSLLSILLYKYTSQSDMIIGCPIAGRDQADLSGQIGFYLNMLALRTRVDTETDFRSVFQGVRKVTLEAYEHQSFPFDELIEALAPVRESGRAPLFDVLID
ncbi:condensation domain-containing protein, partial [Sphingobacterium siyangense]